MRYKLDEIRFLWVSVLASGPNTRVEQGVITAHDLCCLWFSSKQLTICVHLH